MRVTIFRDLKEENWPSMERYPDELVAAFGTEAIDGLHVKQFRLDGVGLPGLPVQGKPGLYLNRAFFYPLRARGQQGEINHVIDHSYAHLLHLLDSHRTIVTCHDLVPMVMRESFPKKSIGMRLWNWAFKGMVKAARIIADSESTKNDILRFSDYDPSNIKVIWLGVSEEYAPVSDEEPLNEIRANFGIPEGLVVLHVGHCAARKNIEGLIRALGMLRRKGLRAHFLQIGGNFSNEQSDLIRDVGMQDGVTQLSGISQNDLVRIYNLSDVLVLPSYYEGFGLPLIEAMACGTPVIAANKSSLPEVAGEAAVLIEPDDIEEMAEKIEQVLTDEALRGQLSERGIERARLFSWERCARQTFDVYRDLYRELNG
jgi:glycosyltransferase involved in cell wall biosynthesis